MRYSQFACLISGLLTLVCGYHSCNSSVEAVNAKPPRSSNPSPNEIMVSLPDPIFIATKGLKILIRSPLLRE